MQSILTLQEITCAECENYFGVPAHIIAKRRQDGRAFYCPLGHGNVYKDNEYDRLKRENKQLKDQKYWLERKNQSTYQQLADTKKEKANVKRQLTNTRKRIANGVCPCCHRTFTQLSRHITSKHPDFKAAVS